MAAHLALGALAEVPAPRLSRDLGPVLGRAVADDVTAFGVLALIFLVRGAVLVIRRIPHADPAPCQACHHPKPRSWRRPGRSCWLGKAQSRDPLVDGIAPAARGSNSVAILKAFAKALNEISMM